MFREFSNYGNDPIEAMFVRLAEDDHPDKIDLGIGVFRNDEGKVPDMETPDFWHFAPMVQAQVDATRA